MRLLMLLLIVGFLLSFAFFGMWRFGQWFRRFKRWLQLRYHWLKGQQYAEDEDEEDENDDDFKTVTYVKRPKNQ